MDAQIVVTQFECTVREDGMKIVGTYAVLVDGHEAATRSFNQSYGLQINIHAGIFADAEGICAGLAEAVIAAITTPKPEK